jgi:lipopolysaccharide/colanic/teichoic acid biosynthesis glycosyltransferase
MHRFHEWTEVRWHNESGDAYRQTGGQKQLKSERIIKSPRVGTFFPWIGTDPKNTGGDAALHGNARAGSLQIPRWKRCLDLFCILLSLPVLLPIVLLISLGILIVSPGPVFFRQERIGYRGRRFQCLKFRSMKVGAETRSHENYLQEIIRKDRPMTKLDASNDPRLIPFGKFFRASGLDELPQLWNVVRGDMSLVGPRPCTVGEFEHFNDWQRSRCDAPPGLTGYWQVNGKNKTTFSKMIAMDVFYANNMSLGMDLGILLKTAPVLASQVFETRKFMRSGKKEIKPFMG